MNSFYRIVLPFLDRVFCKNNNNDVVVLQKGTQMSFNKRAKKKFLRASRTSKKGVRMLIKYKNYTSNSNNSSVKDFHEDNSLDYLTSQLDNLRYLRSLKIWNGGCYE